MNRAGCLTVLALSLFALACTPEAESPAPNPVRAGGAGGAAKGGSGGSGSGGSGGSVTSPTSGGSGGGVASGGSIGSGGSATASGGTGGGGTAGSAGGGGSGGKPGGSGGAKGDAPVAGEAGPVPADETLPNKPWIRLCPKAATPAECCTFLCACLAKTCADSPRDNPAMAACQSSCMNLNNMQMRCRVYHCYESLNPKVPQDHVSHCGHASGRVGGGGCPAGVVN